MTMFAVLVITLVFSSGLECAVVQTKDVPVDVATFPLIIQQDGAEAIQSLPGVIDWVPLPDTEQETIGSGPQLRPLPVVEDPCSACFSYLTNLIEQLTSVIAVPPLIPEGGHPIDPETEIRPLPDVEIVEEEGTEEEAVEEEVSEEEAVEEEVVEEEVAEEEVVEEEVAEEEVAEEEVAEEEVAEEEVAEEEVAEEEVAEEEVAEEEVAEEEVAEEEVAEEEVAEEEVAEEEGAEETETEVEEPSVQKPSISLLPSFNFNNW